MSAPAAPGAPRRAAGALLGIALVAACAAGGFLAYRLTAARPPALYAVPLPAMPAPPAATGPAAPPPPAPAARTIPAVVPPISLPDLAGATRRLADYRGKLLLINFWATWCEPCRREIPLLKALRQERAKDGLEIVGIAVDYPDEVAQYARAKGIDYPLLVGDKGGLEAANAFGMDLVLPFSVFADRNGRVVTLKIGELHPDEARLILDRLTDADRGRLTLAAAREAIASGISRLNAARAAKEPPED